METMLACLHNAKLSSMKQT